jgi:quercetin dioxygenase-like cupin family protein
MHHVDNAVMPTHDWRGMTIRDLTTLGVTWQASFIKIDVPAGAVHPVARSTKCETFYDCDSGELEFEVNDRHFLVKPGDLVEIKANEWYAYRTSSTPAGLLSFNVPPYDASATEYRVSRDIMALRAGPEKPLMWESIDRG